MARLTIPDEQTFATFTATAQTVFPISFALLSGKADLRVSIDGVELNQSDFTFAGSLLDGGGYSGGTVTLNTAATGSVRIWRYVRPTRGTNFAPAGTVPVGSVDQAINRLTATQQDLAYQQTMLGAQDASIAETVFNGKTNSFSRELLTSSSAAAFRLLIGAQSRIKIDAADAPYYCVFDGSDNTFRLQAALWAASVIGATVVMPSGTALFTSTLMVPTGVGLEGKGMVNTYLRKTTEYGPMIQFGTASSQYQSGYVRGFWAYHDYGDGPFPPKLSADVDNPSGDGEILRFYGPYNGWVSEVWANGGRRPLRILGGSTSLFSRCSFQGVWNPTDANLQFSDANLRMEVGPNGQLPTNIDFLSCTFGGQTTPVGSITWPDPGGTGPNVTTDVVRNIGALRNIDILCAESVTFADSYIGTAAKYNVAFRNNGVDLISGVSLSNIFMDAAHEAMVGFEGTGTSHSIGLHCREWNGQLNGFSAITDKEASAVPGAISVLGLEVSGPMRAFVGPPIDLRTARRAEIRSDIRWWNLYGFYTSLSGYNCAVNVGAGSRNFLIAGMVGGDNLSNTYSRTVVGVNIASGATKIDTAGLVNNGLSGALVVGGPPLVAGRIDDANFTLTQRVDVCDIDHYGTLTAARTVTLSKTGAVDGDTWRITRSGGGAFALNVNGVTTAALTTGKWVEFRYFSAIDQIRQTAGGSLL